MIFSLRSNFPLLVPLFSLITFLLLIILLFLNRKYFGKYLRKIKKKTWVILVLIFILGLALRLFLPLHYHKQGNDEFEYMEAAKSLTVDFREGNYLRSIGWPLIIAIFFSLFGVNNWVAIYLSLFLGSLTIFNIFFLSLVLLKNKKIALWSAFLFSLLPLHIAWSGSAETNVPSLFFITLTLFFYIFYTKEKKYSLLWLSIISLAFTVQVRPENYILPILFVFYFFIYEYKGKESFKKINFNFLWPWVTLTFLSFFNFIQVWQFQFGKNWIISDSGGREIGENWGLSNLINNSYSYAIDIFNETYQPIVYSILLGIGVFYLWKRERKASLLLTSYFLIFYLSYFFSWLQSLGGRSRIFMSFYPVTVIFAGAGAYFLFQRKFSFYKRKINKKAIIVSFISVIFLSFSPYFLRLIKEKANPESFTTLLLLETMVPELIKKDIPKQRSIILQWPQVLKATTDFSLLSTDKALRDNKYLNNLLEENQCVLFYEDITCYWDKFHTISKCIEMKKKYNLIPFTKYFKKADDGLVEYIFYLVRKK